MPYIYNSRDTFGDFFKANAAALTASNSAFTSNLNQSGLSGSVSLGSLSSEFSNVVRWVHHRLGEPIMLVELTPEQIAECFEEANLMFSSIVNTYFIESWFAQLLGISQSYSSIDFQSALPSASNMFLKQFVSSQNTMFGGIYGGNATKRRGYIDVTSSRQVYDIYSEGKDQATGLPIEQYVASVSGLGVHFTDVYYNAGAYVSKMYDPYSSQGFLASEFNAQSYQADTVLYVQPLWQDIQRSQMVHNMDYVRKSAFKHCIFGRNIEFIPKPDRDRRIWFSFYVDHSSGDQSNPLLAGGFSGLSYLAASGQRVATNFGNIPIQDLTYANMNSVGRTWVRKYCLGLCMETLAFTRGKFSSVPIPGTGESVTLNADQLLNRSSAITETLVSQLRENLDRLNLYNILEKEVAKAEQLLRLQQLSSPLGVYVDSRLN